ncbi:MAG: hypothetical protein ABI579_00525 [Candidatus Sumerlaeota bacterium]
MRAFVNVETVAIVRRVNERTFNAVAINPSVSRKYPDKRIPANFFAGIGY